LLRVLWVLVFQYLRTFNSVVVIVGVHAVARALIKRTPH
jgi:hypothetical protein